MNLNVFASKAERTNFQKLSRMWGASYRLYHNLPFLNVFNPANLINMDVEQWTQIRQFTLTPLEHNRLKKTSIDYVLCNSEDQPLVALDFDGLSDGFNVGCKYVVAEPGANPWREEITTLKLRVAHGSLFPYFVVGTDHFADLSPGLRYTIVDGVIGEVLANREAHEQIGAGFDPQQCGWGEEEFNELLPDEQQEIIQDWVLGIEVVAEMEKNPLVRERWRMAEELKAHSHSDEFLVWPQIPDCIALPERARLIRNAVLQGSRCTLRTSDCGDVSAKIMLPNFRTPGYSGWTLAGEIAGLVALNRLKTLRERL